jgi:hypothetical protein
MNINFDAEQTNTYAGYWLNFNFHSFHSDHYFHSLQISSDLRPSLLHSVSSLLSYLFHDVHTPSCDGCSFIRLLSSLVVSLSWDTKTSQHCRVHGNS